MMPIHQIFNLTIPGQEEEEMLNALIFLQNVLVSAGQNKIKHLFTYMTEVCAEK